MDEQFFSAFKRYQEQQERINNLMRSPAMEMIKKQQESMQRIIGSSVNASLLNQKENVRLIVKSPAFDMLQKHQENWANIMGSSAVMAFENNLGVKTLLGNQLFDNWSEQQKRINKMINPTINTILVEHQERWNSIFQKVSDFGINYSIFEEIVEELKEVYEEIDDDTVPSANEEVSSQKTRKEIQEFKKQLEDIISYCMYVLGIIHVVDTKVIWDILNKISIIMTILNPVFNEDVKQGEEKNVQIINVNGDNNTINIENSDSGTIIIQTNNNDTEIIIKNEAQKEMGNSSNEIKEISDLDISAGVKS